MCKLASEHSGAVSLRIEGLEARHDALDRRHNRIRATQLESSWAVSVFERLSGENLHVYYADLQMKWKRMVDLDTRVRAGEFAHHQNSSLRKVHKTLIRLPKAELDWLKPLDHYMKFPKQLAEFRYDEALHYKKRMDYLVNFYAVNTDERAKQLYRTSRATAAFQDRGRTPGPADPDERPQDRDAGIADSRHRTPDVRSFFASSHEHAKSFLHGDSASKTWLAFKEAGAPFIGGASGTFQAVIICLEMDSGPLADLDPEQDASEIERRHRILCVSMAELVSGGHHSLSECLLVGQGLGYFSHIPEPIGGPGQYEVAMKALHEYLSKLGLAGGLVLA